MEEERAFSRGGTGWPWSANLRSAPLLPAGTSAARFPQASRLSEQVTEEASEGLGGVGGVGGS